MTKKGLEQKRREQTRDEISKGRISQGIGKAFPAGDGKIKGGCFQRQNTGKCARGDTCPFDHDPDKKGSSKGKGKGNEGNKSRDSSVNAQRSGKSDGKGNSV